MAKFSDVLLASDFDRTLSGCDGTIPQANLDAIRYFMDEGGAFTGPRAEPHFPRPERSGEQGICPAPELVEKGRAFSDSFCSPLQRTRCPLKRTTRTFAA